MTEPLTRAEQKQQTRETIMTAAVRKMNDDRGFSSLSLREVAKEAGIAPASFYRHFENMEDLALAFLGHIPVLATIIGIGGTLALIAAFAILD